MGRNGIRAGYISLAVLGLFLSTRSKAETPILLHLYIHDVDQRVTAQAQIAQINDTQLRITSIYQSTSGIPTKPQSQVLSLLSGKNSTPILLGLKDEANPKLNYGVSIRGNQPLVLFSFYRSPSGVAKFKLKHSDGLLSSATRDREFELSQADPEASLKITDFEGNIYPVRELHFYEKRFMGLWDGLSSAVHISHPKNPELIKIFGKIIEPIQPLMRLSALASKKKILNHKNNN